MGEGPRRPARLGRRGYSVRARYHEQSNLFDEG